MTCFIIWFDYSDGLIACDCVFAAEHYKSLLKGDEVAVLLHYPLKLTADNEEKRVIQIFRKRGIIPVKIGQHQSSPFQRGRKTLLADGVVAEKGMRVKAIKNCDKSVYKVGDTGRIVKADSRIPKIRWDHESRPQKTNPADLNAVEKGSKNHKHFKYLKVLAYCFAFSHNTTSDIACL